MVDQLTLQTIGIGIAAVSVVVGVMNSILMSRKEDRRRELTLRNQEITLETRQMNTYMELKRNVRDIVSSWNEVIFQHEWKDYDEWVEKYGPLTNPDAFGDTMLVFEFINGIGLLVRKGILDIDIVCEQWGGGTIEAWEKLNPIVKAWREEGETNVYASFEHLHQEVREKMPEYVVFREWIADPQRT